MDVQSTASPNQAHEWQHWDQRYASPDRVVLREPDATLVELVRDLPPGRAVDLGAGEGRNSLWLARRRWNVTAVDLSEVGLRRLTHDAAAEGLRITTVVADVYEYLDRGEQFELVVVANMHPPLEQRDRLLAGAARAVAPGGHLYLIGHHVDSFGLAGPPDRTRLYTEESLKGGAFPGLEVLQIERRERQRGTGGPPLVDAIAWATRAGLNNPVSSQPVRSIS
jgi:SAM-dependent methyltransferase